MRLYANCHNCRNEIRFSTSEPDRVELSKSKGNKIELTCNHCGQTDSYHVNKIKATESKIAQIIGLIIFIVGTPLTLYLIWGYIFRFTYIYVIAGLIGLIGIPFMIYAIIEKEQRKKIRLFNNYKISE
mgnify:CR=1 FL=1